MLKKLLAISTILSLLVFTSSLISPVRAQSEISQASNDIMSEFCQRRQGGIINLETWYAGECNPDDDTSTFSGAKLGFGDIIILHIYELLNGEGSSGTEEEIIDKVLGVFSLSDSGEKLDYLTLIDVLSKNPPDYTNNTGLVANAGQMVGAIISHPPASSIDYLASVKSNMSKHSLVKPAYAQTGAGYGFTNFQGFLPMWRAFRNISYFFFVLAFVAYGFAIMFRLKLGQAAVTIQQALPKLVVTLLVITFSYAIVGLLVDLMWVLYYVVLNTLGTFNVFGGSNPANNLILQAFSGNYGLIASGFLQTVAGIIALPYAISALVGIPGVLGYIITIGLAILNSGISIIIIVIFLIAILIAFAKLFIKLITAYVTIIGNLILAPLILLPDAIPGRGGAFGKWLNNLIANIAVFPVSSLLLLFSGYFMAQPVLDLINSRISNIGPAEAFLATLPGGAVTALDPLETTTPPPRVPLLNPSIFGVTQQSDSGGWMAVIGIAILLMAPKFVDMIKGAFNVKPMQLGIGETVAGGVAGRSLLGYTRETYGTQQWDSAKAFNQLAGLMGGKLGLPEKK